MNINDAFRAALKWAVLGTLCLAISIYVLISGLSDGTKAYTTIPLLVLAVVSFVQSWRTVRFFYPGAYLMCAGVAIIFLAPMLQSFLWGFVLTFVSSLVGPESELATIFVGPVVEFFRTIGMVGELSVSDVACFVVGIVLCLLGIRYGQEPSLTMNISKSGEIEIRVGRSATPEQIRAAVKKMNGDS